MSERKFNGILVSLGAVILLNFAGWAYVEHGNLDIANDTHRSAVFTGHAAAKRYKGHGERPKEYKVGAKCVIVRYDYERGLMDCEWKKR